MPATFRDSQALRSDLRRLLGAERAAPIEARAEELGASFAGREEGWLRAAGDALDEPLDSLRDADRRITSLRGRHEFARRELEGARRREEQATKRALSRDPAVRDGAGREIQSADREAEAAQAELARIAAGWQPGDERHPAAWLEANGERAARVIALRGALERQVGAERAVPWASPPRQIPDPLLPYVDALGPELAAEIDFGSEAIGAEVAGKSWETRSQLREELGRPYERIEHANLVEAGQLRRDREGLEQRHQILDARVEQLEATGYRPEAADTLRHELRQNEIALGAVRERQLSAWAENRAAGEAWLREHRQEAVESVAVERSVAAEVEQQIRQRELEEATAAEPKLVRDYMPPATELAVEDGGIGL